MAGQGKLMHHPFAGIALHIWTLDTTPLPEAIATAKRAGFDAVEVRRVDFRRQFEAGLSNSAVLEIIRNGGLKISAVGVEYGWIFGQGDESKRLFGVFRESCENAVALGCDLLMSALGPGTGTLGTAVASVRNAGDLAAEFGLRLALEFQFQHPIVNRLEILRDIIARAGRRNVGLLLDAYHLQRHGRIGRGFEDVPGAEIFYFQYSDVPDALPNAAPPTDRLAPGAGVVPWADVLQLLADKGYRGFLSYEAPNTAYWNSPANEVARQGLVATQHVLGQAFPAGA